MQTINQKRALKVAIGSKYQGPSFDRPCLRQMPSHWTLEETRKKPRPFLSPDAWVMVAVIVGWLFVVVQTVAQVLK